MTLTTQMRASSTLALQSARRRLASWRTRVDSALAARSRLDAEASEQAEPFVREFQDRLARVENAVLRLHRVESAWQRARADVDCDFSQLEQSWNAMHYALSPD
jgi:hypothetical protein